MNKLFPINVLTTKIYDVVFFSSNLNKIRFKKSFIATLLTPVTFLKGVQLVCSYNVSCLQISTEVYLQKKTVRTVVHRYLGIVKDF